MSACQDPRNAAIAAHADHGKTILVDAILWEAGAFGVWTIEETTGECVMDSGELEHEKGITILAKNTAVYYSGPSVAVVGCPEGIVTDVIDTPGHADFGGEIEHGLSMVDGIVLLVDASEGPPPQTRFALCRALVANLPVILVVNKVDRPDSRLDEVASEFTDLLLSPASDLANEYPDVDLDAVLDVLVIYASAEVRRADTEAPVDGELLANENPKPLFRAIIEWISGPPYEEDAPLQTHVTNLDVSPFLGCLVLLCTHGGILHKGQTMAWTRHDGSLASARVSELLVTEGLGCKPAEEAHAGDIVAVAGIEDTITGESSMDPEDPRPLLPIIVDGPAIAMTTGTSTFPMAGRTKGAKVTVRQVKDRLDRELISSVSLRALPTIRSDAWEVQGRGELALAILVGQMCCEGFELTVGKPQVVTRTIDDERHEPIERTTIDVLEEYLGAVTQLVVARKGQMETMTNHGTGWIHMELPVPARGLIGFRTQFLTETCGTGIASSIAEGYAPWAGKVASRTTGSLVSDRARAVTAYALIRLQDRGSFLVEPTQETYERQVAGEDPRGEDMDVNVAYGEQQINACSSTADTFETLVPPCCPTLEEAPELVIGDECVEITLEAVRIRKVILNSQERPRENARRCRVET